MRTPWLALIRPLPRWLVIPLLATTVGACAPGFYTLQQASLAVTAPSRTTPRAQPVATRVIPYLTLTAYSDVANLTVQDPDASKQTVLLSLNATYKRPGASTELTTNLLHVSLKPGSQKSAALSESAGHDFLRTVPLELSSNEAVNIRLSLHFVEENLADKFTRGLQAISKITGPLLSSGSPAAASGLSVAHAVLGEFQSNANGSDTSYRWTLNTPGRAPPQEYRVLLLVPTGTTTPDAEKRDGSSDYAQRLAEISKVKLVLCKSGTGVCTGNDVPYRDYGYVLVKAAYTFRVSHADFVWTTSGAGCAFGREGILGHRARIAAMGPGLSASQRAQEKGYLASADRLLEVTRGFREKNPEISVRAILQELQAPVSEEPLYGMVTDNFPTYAQLRKRLRACMQSETKGHALGLFHTLSKAISHHDAAIAIEASTAEDKKKLRLALESTLLELKVGEASLRDFDSPPGAKARVARRIPAIQRLAAVAERRLVAQFYQPLIDAANSSDRGIAKPARLRLSRLGLTHCESCRAMISKYRSGRLQSKVAKLSGQLATILAVARASKTLTPSQLEAVETSAAEIAARLAAPDVGKKALRGIGKSLKALAASAK